MGEVVRMATPDQLAADLTAAMDHLWEEIAELEPHEWETAQVAPGWTPKAVLAHVAFWDDYDRRRMEAALAGMSRGAFARPAADNDARAARDADRPWDEVVAAATAARAALVTFARELPPAALAATYAEGDRQFSVLAQLQHLARHTAEHAASLHAYCGSLARWTRAGLRAMMEEQHANLLDACAGLDEATMLATAVCGVWSIRDVLAHVASWNELCARLVVQWPEPDPATIREWAWQPGDTMAAMNDRLMAARRDLTLIEVYDALSTYHRRILSAYDRTADVDLESVGATWGAPGPLGCFLYEVYVHEAEHAAQIWAYRAGLMDAEAGKDRSDDAL